MKPLVLNISRSCKAQAWQFRCKSDEMIADLRQSQGLDELTARLLAGRGVSSEDVPGFLTPKLKDQMPDPSSMQDMDQAARLIVDAALGGENIVVFADYDVDGATSAAQLIRWGRSIGCDIGLYVPDRIKEGYGPSVQAFEHLKSSGAELVITVDCGAAAHEALHEAENLDLPIIVIDHHQMTDQGPPCAALVNPNRPDDSSGLGTLSAAGVSFMLVTALNRELRKREIKSPLNPMELLGLAALGTLCDVMPLSGLNRVFVAQGLKILGQNHIVGLKALADVSQISPPYTSYHAGFVLGPRLNAGGRIGRSDLGAELLSTDDEALAYKHAQELEQVNKDRRAMQDAIMREAEAEYAKANDEPLIILAMPEWHPGIIGIVAGRLKDQWGRPAIIIGLDDEGLGKGSGRSIQGVDLGSAIIAAKQSGILKAGGGHAMAAGLTIEAEKIPELKAFLHERLAEDIKAARAQQHLSIDGLLTIGAVNGELIDSLEQIAPFGAGNPQPVFVFPSVRVAYAARLKGGHVRCTLSDETGQTLKGICFRAEESGLADWLLSPQEHIFHIAGRLKRDVWQGRTQIDLNIVDMALIEPI